MGKAKSIWLWQIKKGGGKPAGMPQPPHNINMVGRQIHKYAAHPPVPAPPETPWPAKGQAWALERHPRHDCIRRVDQGQLSP